jgi:hypothetical protein
MIIGANVNSYLRRGAEFDVMRNVEAGVEDAGEGSTSPAGLLRACSRDEGSISVRNPLQGWQRRRHA